MNELKDIGGFFGVMAIAAANPFGIRSAIWKALSAAWKGADRGQAAFRKHLGSFLYLQVVAVLLLCATALGFFLAAGHGSLAWGPALPKGFDNWSLAFFQKTTFYCVVALVMSAGLTFVVGWKKPMHALPVFALVGVVMLVCLWLPFIGFVTHAFRSGNGWLFFIAGGVAGFALLVTFTFLTALGWVIEKAIVIFEKTIELASIVGAIGPGITLANYKEVFAEIIDMLDQRKWREAARNLPANLGAAVTVFMILGSYDLSVEWGIVVSCIMVPIIAMGVVFGLQRNLREDILKSRRKFLWGVYGFGVLPLLVFRVAAFYKPIGDKLEWVKAFFRGEESIGQGATFWGSAALIIAGAIAVKYVWKFSDGWKDGFKGKSKGVLRLAAALFLLFGGISMLVALGVIGSKSRGFTFSTPPGNETEQVNVPPTSRPKGMPQDDAQQPASQPAASTAPSSTVPATKQVRPQPAVTATEPVTIAAVPAGNLTPRMEALRQRAKQRGQ